VNVIGPEVDQTGVYALVSGSVYAGGSEVRDLPITFTVADGTTQQTLGSFSGTSNGLSSCTVRLSLNYPTDTIQTWTGAAVGAYAACPLAPISLSTADVPLISASFAGSSTLGPSASSLATAPAL
jgi:hypothetical protein